MSINRTFFVSAPSFDRTERHRFMDWRSSPIVGEDGSTYEKAHDADVSLRMLIMGAKTPSGTVHYFDHSKFRLVTDKGAAHNGSKHIIPASYKALQKRLVAAARGEDGGVENLSSYFDWLACDPQRLSKTDSAFVRYYSETFRTDLKPASKPGDVMSHSTWVLMDRVSHQLKYGPAFFDAEAILTYLTAYWQHVNLVVQSYETNAEVTSAAHAFIYIANGNHDMALAYVPTMCQRLRSDNGGFSLTTMQRSALLLFKIFLLADLLYRRAVCETRGQERFRKLNEARVALLVAEDAAYNYRKRCDDPSVDPVVNHFTQIRALIAEGMEHTDGNGTCKPLGLIVPDFGPTSARLSEITVGTKTHLAISAYTPIKP